MVYVTKNDFNFIQCITWSMFYKYEYANCGDRAAGGMSFVRLMALVLGLENSSFLSIMWTVQKVATW